jgi:CRP-like cAMP-binding protein
VKAEKETIQLDAFELTPLPQGGGALLVKRSHQRFQLSPLQFSYFQVLERGVSIESLVDFFLKQGWLVSFRELFSLVKFLIDQGLILNPTLKDYFSHAEPQEKSLFEKVWGKIAATETASTSSATPLKELPFFRSLAPDLANYLLQKVSKLSVPAQIRIIHSGARDRDLYILTKGKVGVYKTLPDNRRQLVAQLGAGSLFGERGFLLGQARTADIVTLEPCEVLKVSHLPEFDNYIKNDRAQQLQHRFIALQALSSSDFFKDMPSDTLDSLIFQGQLVQAKANMTLFGEGQAGNTCYILLQGSVLISQKGKVINVLNQGSCFGEISLLMNGGIRTATVTTQNDSVFLELNQNAFYKILGQNLILAKEIETLAATRLQKDHQR